jgi:hypothetical protein
MSAFGVAARETMLHSSKIARIYVQILLKFFEVCALTEAVLCRFTHRKQSI